MSQTAIIIVGVVAYVIIAYSVALYLTYYNEKNGDWSLPPKVVLVWPIMLVLVIIAGPFRLAEHLGTEARTKRIFEVHQKWLRDQDQAE